jgi:hypothetical protein
MKEIVESARIMEVEVEEKKSKRLNKENVESARIMEVVEVVVEVVEEWLIMGWKTNTKEA